MLAFSSPQSNYTVLPLDRLKFKAESLYGGHCASKMGCYSFANFMISVQIVAWIYPVVSITLGTVGS